MRQYILLTTIALISIVCCTSAQEIPKHQVPPIVMSSFQKDFMSARDAEWKLDGELYKVEFELANDADHEVWYDKSGKQVKHQEEIKPSRLPQKVLDLIRKEYGNYRIDEAKKITEGLKLSYAIELKSEKKELKLTVDSAGNLLSKMTD
ncbi:MAG TPA: PepSY-like domain-containing protein [Flavihumibacter sp.]